MQINAQTISPSQSWGQSLRARGISHLADRLVSNQSIYGNIATWAAGNWFFLLKNILFIKDSSGNIVITWVP